MSSLLYPERTSSSTFSVLFSNDLTLETRSRPINFKLLRRTFKLLSCSSRFTCRSFSSSSRSNSTSLALSCSCPSRAMTCWSFSSVCWRQAAIERSYSSRSWQKVDSTSEQMAVFSASRYEMGSRWILSLMYSSIILQLPSSPTSSPVNCRLRWYSSSSDRNFSLPADSLLDSFRWQSSISCWNLFCSSLRLLSKRSSLLRRRSQRAAISSSLRVHCQQGLPCFSSQNLMIFCRQSSLVANSRRSIATDPSNDSSYSRTASFSSRSCSVSWCPPSIVNLRESASVLNLGVLILKALRSTSRSCSTAPMRSRSIFMRSISESLSRSSSARERFSCSRRSMTDSSRRQCLSMGELESGRGGSRSDRSCVCGCSLQRESLRRVVLLAQLLLTEEGVLLTRLSAAMRECCSLMIFSIISMRLMRKFSSSSRRPIRYWQSPRMLFDSSMNRLSCYPAAPTPAVAPPPPRADSSSIRSLSMFLKDCSLFSFSDASSRSRRFFSSSSSRTFSLSASESCLERRALLSWEMFLLRSSCRLRRWFSWFRRRFWSARRRFSCLRRPNSSTACRYLCSSDRLSEGAICEMLLSRSNRSSRSSAFRIFERMSSTSIVVFLIMFFAARSGLGDLHGSLRVFRRSRVRIDILLLLKLQCPRSSPRHRQSTLQVVQFHLPQCSPYWRTVLTVFNIRWRI